MGLLQPTRIIKGSPHSDRKNNRDFRLGRRNNHPSSRFSSRRQYIIAISSCPNDTGGGGLLHQPYQQSTEGSPALSDYSWPN
eukprot:scaffold68823_cov43-Attheya_sp.AAC.1